MQVTQGPQPWILKPSTYYMKLIAFDLNKNQIIPTILREPHFSKSSSITYQSDIVGQLSWNDSLYGISSNQPEVTGFVKDSESGSGRIFALNFEQSDGKPRLISFSLRCEQFGTFIFNLELGNQPSTLNNDPMKLSSNFTYVLI